MVVASAGVPVSPTPTPIPTPTPTPMIFQSPMWTTTAAAGSGGFPIPYNNMLSSAILSNLEYEASQQVLRTVLVAAGAVDVMFIDKTVDTAYGFVSANSHALVWRTLTDVFVYYRGTYQGAQALLDMDLTKETVTISGQSAKIHAVSLAPARACRKWRGVLKIDKTVALVVASVMSMKASG
jgi:hypothetical protein